jgi:hypothetical protein
MSIVLTLRNAIDMAQVSGMLAGLESLRQAHVPTNLKAAKVSAVRITARLIQESTPVWMARQREERGTVRAWDDVH